MQKKNHIFSNFRGGRPLDPPWCLLVYYKLYIGYIVKLITGEDIGVKGDNQQSGTREWQIESLIDN